MSVYEKMTALANAIRGKTGGTDLLTLDGMAEAVNGLPTGGGDIAPFTKIETGTYTPSQNVGAIDFISREGLRYFLLEENTYASDLNLGANIIIKMCVFLNNPQASRLVVAMNKHWTMPNYADGTDILQFPGNSTTTLYLGAGVTYNWIAVYTE